MTAGQDPSSPQRPDTVLGVLRAAETWLRRQAVDEPRRSVELLIGHVLGIPRLQIYLQHDRPLDARELAELRALVARRARHEPISHLLGTVDFCGLSFVCGPQALVPRPETEGLVERALVAPHGGTVADLGTGSGAIAVAIAVRRPDLRVVAVDIDPDALALAQTNAARHAVTDRIEFRREDFATALTADDAFDVVVSNPPYVDPSRPDLLDPSVRRYEPALALFTVPGDPSSTTRRLLPSVERALRDGGTLLLETGVGADVAMAAALRAMPWLDGVTVEPDLDGHPRYVSARRRSP